ncbi:MBL fold metallo-hydrolase [Actinopolymorpha sp. B17G11]|uniref:MBL fold metallo-hydrolase n=1 Tax=Actinopolymorpha sp. B17G11 TaxID=3160861 RepID=UPI0032E3D0F8
MDTNTHGWTEVGPGCFARRYPSYDLTIGAVVGADGILLVDTRASLGEADELRADLRRLSRAPVRWVVDTHWHFDHCFGNARFADAVIYGHESVPAMLEARADGVRAELSARSAEWATEMAALEVVPPGRTFASVAMADLGDRVVELVHPGRGHTDGDVVVRVPDADVVYVGDLVEESGPPSYGDDSYPLEWGATLDVVAGLLTTRTAVVPGHGTVVDHAYVGEQRGDLVGVAGTIRRLVEERVPIERAWEAAEWPWSREALAEAIRRGYAQLRDTRGRRTLPLV